MLVAGASLSAQAPGSFSDRPATSLEARVRALEAELAAARQSLQALAPVVEVRLDALDRQIRVTERLAELEREKAIDEAKAAPRVTAGREGFSLQSADKAFN